VNYASEPRNTVKYRDIIVILQLASLLLYTVPCDVKQRSPVFHFAVSRGLRVSSQCITVDIRALFTILQGVLGMVSFGSQIWVTSIIARLSFISQCLSHKIILPYKRLW
jgi:hypothetical protein